MKKKACIYGCFEVLPIEAFGNHPRTHDGLATRCKNCEADRIQRAKHGVTRSEKAQIALEQDGCAICGRPDPGGRGWAVDHDHRCCPGERSCPNCRRAVLCTWCNAALGYAFDSPTLLHRMADYLELQTRMPGV